MTLSAKDFRALWPCLALTLVTVLAGASLIGMANGAIDAAKSETNAARAARDTAQARLQQLVAGESKIRDDAALFATLTTRGIIGDGEPPEWVELLKALRDRHHLPDLRYKTEPQRRLEEGSTGSVSPVASAMHLQIDLLHEEDLTRFLADLQQRASAVPLIQSCQLTRLTDVAQATANLQATCRIDWITFKFAPVDQKETR